MDKEKLIKLRKKINELFFKKSFQNEESLKKKKYLAILL